MRRLKLFERNLRKKKFSHYLCLFRNRFQLIKKSDWDLGQEKRIQKHKIKSEDHSATFFLFWHCSKRKCVVSVPRKKCNYVLLNKYKLHHLFVKVFLYMDMFVQYKAKNWPFSTESEKNRQGRKKKHLLAVVQQNILDQFPLSFKSKCDQYRQVTLNLICI